MGRAFAAAAATEFENGLSILPARSDQPDHPVAASGPAAECGGPVRTCVGCRERAAASSLLRVVAVEGVLVPDQRHLLPGRGAWLHPRVGCLDVAERRRAFGRALRLSVSPETTEIRAFLAPDPSGPDVANLRIGAVSSGTARAHRKQVDPS